MRHGVEVRSHTLANSDHMVMVYGSFLVLNILCLVYVKTRVLYYCLLDEIVEGDYALSGRTM